MAMKYLLTAIRPPGLVITAIATLHLTYAICMLVNPEVMDITALFMATRLFGVWSPSIFLLVGAFALMPRFYAMTPAMFQVCVWPQQTILLLMSVSVFAAVARGSYPDGTVKFPLFIFTDQCQWIIFTLAHLSATLRNLANGHVIR
jgi:hypothetical protein